MLETLVRVTARNKKLHFESNVTRQKLYKTKIIGSTRQDKNNRDHTRR